MKKALALLLTLVMVCGLCVTAQADDAGMDELIAAAQAEGELVVYGSCEEDYLAAATKHFEELYGLSERTIIRLIRVLAKAGYIRVEDNDGGRNTRKLYAGINPLAAPPDKNVSTPLTEMSVPPDKNVTPNKIRKDTRKEDHIPPKPPEGAGGPKSIPQWKPERFEAFWRYYPAIPDGNGRGRRPAKDRAIRAWDKLRADDQEIDAMASALRRMKDSRQWREGIGIPYASTWLNSRAWRDEVVDLEQAEAPQHTRESFHVIDWEPGVTP